MREEGGRAYGHAAEMQIRWFVLGWWPSRYARVCRVLHYHLSRTLGAVLTWFRCYTLVWPRRIRKLYVGEVPAYRWKRLPPNVSERRRLRALRNSAPLTLASYERSTD